MKDTLDTEKEPELCRRTHKFSHFWCQTFSNLARDKSSFEKAWNVSLCRLVHSTDLWSNFPGSTGNIHSRRHTWRMQREWPEETRTWSCCVQGVFIYSAERDGHKEDSQLSVCGQHDWNGELRRQKEATQATCTTQLVMQMLPTPARHCFLSSSRPLLACFFSQVRGKFTAFLSQDR